MASPDEKTVLAAYGYGNQGTNEIDNDTFNVINLAMSTEIRTVLAFTGLTVGAVTLYGGKNFILFFKQE